MKRLLTIFLSSLLGMGLWAQQAGNVPVTNIGDIYNVGPVYSKGSIHMKALSDEQVGRLDNYGDLVVGDTIVFYTNDEREGLLKNNHSSANGKPEAAAGGMAVSKAFLTEKYYYTISLPFDVDLATGVINPKTGQPLTRGVNFQVQYYDALRRATVGRNEVQNWVIVPNSSSTTAEKEQYIKVIGESAFGNKMKKGLVYRVSVISGTSGFASPAAGEVLEVVFASNKTDADYALNNDDKGSSLRYFPPHDTLSPGHTDANPLTDLNNKYWSDGWNYIGGLNPDLFILDGLTSTWQRTVYYWNDDTSGAFEELFPLAKTGVLRPYSGMFVRTNEGDATKLNFVAGSDRSAYGGFSFYYEGNELDLPTSSSIPVFRSIQDRKPSEDVLSLLIEDSKNSGKNKETYFRFKDGYNTYYSSKDNDDLSMSVSKNKTSLGLWSIAKTEIDNKEYNSYLFVNALPYTGQEIPLGINIPAAGTYVISLDHLKDTGLNKLKSVILYDRGDDLKSTSDDKRVELLNSSYTFTVKSDVYKTDRFVLFFNPKDMTGIDQLSEVSDVYAYAENNILTIKNLLSGDRIQVLDVTGRTIVTGVATGNTFTANLNQKGVYIVNVRGGKTLKVLNK